MGEQGGLPAGWVWPSARHLSASPNRAELRQALRRDRLWWPSDIYLVGEDGPMEDRAKGDGSTVMWYDEDHWLVGHSERGQVDSFHACKFDDEAGACRWVYDEAYLRRYRPAVNGYVAYAADAGDDAAAEGARRHRELLEAANRQLGRHPSLGRIHRERG